MSNIRAEHLSDAFKASIIASVRDAHRQPLRQPDLPPEVAEDQAIAAYRAAVARKDTRSMSAALYDLQRATADELRAGKPKRSFWTFWRRGNA